MSRYVNNLLSVTRYVYRNKRFGSEVIHLKNDSIMNRNFSFTNMFRQQTETATNESSNNNCNFEFDQESTKIFARRLDGEENEWVDVPADKVKLPHALDICTEDVSYIAKDLKPTFNFAAYADKSSTIQELIKLGVELYKLDAKPKAMECLLRRNFEDMKPYIQFLHDCGVPPDKIGRSITKNPLLFENDMDDMHTRIRYLRAHNFSRQDISEIVTKNPLWLNYDTKTIDSRLAFFQREFMISGHQTRLLAALEPRLITYKPMKIWEKTFSVREEMGFDKKQVRMILLQIPTLWMRGRHLNVAVFDYVHNEMKMSHEMIANMPKILITPIERVKNRHEFLKLLGRAQYNPTKPLYVSLDSLTIMNDYEFCTNVAKTSIEIYDMFLKTR